MCGPPDRRTTSYSAVRILFTVLFAFIFGERS